MRKVFEKWLQTSAVSKRDSLYSKSTSYAYANCIGKISDFIKETEGVDIDLYEVDDIDLLEDYAKMFRADGAYSNKGNEQNATIRNAMDALVKFRIHIADKNIDQSNMDIDAISIEFGYEKDLERSIVGQIPTLFPEYKLAKDGIQFRIKNKFIDILLEDKEGNLLVLELKLGEAKETVIGQALMYIDLLEEEYPN
ncbi:MAG: hypothetical protein ACK5IJ_08570 [Mangrovibacterium sp.]